MSSTMDHEEEEWEYYAPPPPGSGGGDSCVALTMIAFLGVAAVAGIAFFGFTRTSKEDIGDALGEKLKDAGLGKPSSKKEGENGEGKTKIDRILAAVEDNRNPKTGFGTFSNIKGGMTAQSGANIHEVVKRNNGYLADILANQQNGGSKKGSVMSNAAPGCCSSDNGEMDCNVVPGCSTMDCCDKVLVFFLVLALVMMIAMSPTFLLSDGDEYTEEQGALTNGVDAAPGGGDDVMTGYVKSDNASWEYNGIRSYICGFAWILIAVVMLGCLVQYCRGSEKATERSKPCRGFTFEKEKWEKYFEKNKNNETAQPQNSSWTGNKCPGLTDHNRRNKAKIHAYCSACHEQFKEYQAAWDKWLEEHTGNKDGVEQLIEKQKKSDPQMTEQQRKDWIKKFNGDGEAKSEGLVQALMSPRACNCEGNWRWLLLLMTLCFIATAIFGGAWFIMSDGVMGDDKSDLAGILCAAATGLTMLFVVIACLGKCY